MMRRKIEILPSLAFLAAVITACYFPNRQVEEDLQWVSISTDKPEYRVGEAVQVNLRNLGDHPIDIFCPEFCATGNFPTRVENFSAGEWQYLIGFCPNLEPAFERGTRKDGYIRHRLPLRGFFELKISNFEAPHLKPGERLRIVYYLGAEKVPIYSNEFMFKP
jgi:hypothetical protein